MSERLTRLETIYLSVWCVMGTGILAIPFAIGQFTIRDGWLSVTVVLFTGVVLVAIAFVHRSSFPIQSVVEGFKLAFGRYIGGLFSIWYTLCLYIVAATVWRELVIFLGVTAYPEASLSLLAAVLVFPVAYGVYKGIKSVALFSDFLAPIAVVVIIGFVILSGGNMHFDTMSPVLSDGLTPILRGSIVPGITYVLEPLVILQFMRDLGSAKSLAWDFAISVVVIFCFLLVLEVVSIGVLGEALSSLRYPVLEVVRSIRVSEFVERLDTLYVMGVLSSLYVKLAVFQYAFCKAVQELFGLSSHQVIAWVGTLFSWAGSMYLFSDTEAVGEFILLSTPAYFIVTFMILPVASAWFYKFLGGRSKVSSST